MNWIDIVICIPLVWGLYKGFTKGLVIELATLAAFFLGIWGAIHFSDLVSALLHDWGLTSEYLPVIAFCLVFLGIIIGIYAFGKFVDRTVRAASLGLFNKLGGALFGTLKFAMLLSVLFFVIDAVEKSYPLVPLKAKESSLLYRPVSQIAPYVIPGLKDSKVGGIPGRDSTGIFMEF
ncbi:MAG: CvpA family protein [Bacteroidota bacterium]